MAIIAKCRCVTCSTLVEKWIDDKCVGCYHDAIKAPFLADIAQYQAEHLALLKSKHVETSRLREVELENNRFWSSCVEQYRSRFEVQIVDQIKSYAFNVAYFFWSVFFFIRVFTIGAYRSFPRLLK